MNNIKKFKIKLQLKDCDYNIAKLAIDYMFSRNKLNELKDELAKIIDEFMAYPSFDTALKVIECNPDFYIFFIESKPDGFFVRNLDSIKNGK